ncbi:MAG: tetratricopeptide repeat protein [Thermoguttaceae bacterium]
MEADRPIRPPRSKHSAALPVVCGLAAIVVLAVFAPTLRHSFVNFDDDRYVYENPPVAQGLSASGTCWALTASHAANWHPITWLSHMADCQIYGLRPWGHHGTNVLLHAATAVMLLLAFQRMTGAVWPSALAALLFAVHPLRVESVAWVAERKDILGGLFFAMTLWAYAGYARREFSWPRYLSVVVLFALGLMSKPTLVTLPLVLLLLDVWPLGRLGKSWPGVSNARSLTFHPILEKLPLFGLTLLSCLVTLWAQRSATASFDAVPVGARLANAVVAYATYLREFFYPVGLAVFYPYAPSDLTPGRVGAAATLLVAATVAAVAVRRRAPYATVGWFWFLVVMTPMIGLVQVGSQAMADRYTYLSQIGLAMALAWGIWETWQAYPNVRLVLQSAAIAWVVVLAACAWRQTSFWQDSETLWRRALACAPDNAFARNNLGLALLSQGRRDEAIGQFEAALKLSDRLAEAHCNLAIARAQQGQFDKAIAEYRAAIAADPNQFKALNNLGSLLAQRGQWDEAVACFQRAVAVRPDYAGAHRNLGLIFRQQRRYGDAVGPWREAVRLDPTDPATVRQLVLLLAVCPDAAVRNGAEAVQVAQRAVERSRQRSPIALETLALALAAVGRSDEAAQAVEQAIALAAEQGDAAMADSLRAKWKIGRTNAADHEAHGKGHR